MANILVRGDALEPSSYDLIVQTKHINVGDPLPEGWQVLSGNARMSEIARIVYRCDIEENLETQAETGE